MKQMSFNLVSVDFFYLFSTDNILHVIILCIYDLNYITQDQLSKIFERKFDIIFLSISLNMCFGYSKEPSH